MTSTVRSGRRQRRQGQYKWYRQMHRVLILTLLFIADAATVATARSADESIAPWYVADGVDSLIKVITRRCYHDHRIGCRHTVGVTETTLEMGKEVARASSGFTQWPSPYAAMIMTLLSLLVPSLLQTTWWPAVPVVTAPN